MIDKLNEQLRNLYKGIEVIDGGDLDKIAESTPFSRFTVWQYFTGSGKSISTAETLLKAAMDIVDSREKSIERAEIMSEDLNNE